MYIKEQTRQWAKEKVQKDKQRSIKLTYKTKDRVTLTTGACYDFYFFSEYSKNHKGGI